ncbi:hypothetical protein BYT27DRAFT_7333106 [Phlegmacium glaucopus]|nr:hypothetical protein BYT27DRAFT_7333106 [Phlegmacium glaucopus]
MKYKYIDKAEAMKRVCAFPCKALDLNKWVSNTTTPSHKSGSYSQPTPYNLTHISSRIIASNRSTGTHPVYGQMGALNNIGAGRARSPSGNPPDGSVQPKRTKHHRSGPLKTQKQQRGREDLSAYQVPVVETVTTAELSPGVSTSPAAAETRRRGRGNIKTKARKVKTFLLQRRSMMTTRTSTEYHLGPGPISSIEGDHTMHRLQ